jgi:hypothetical protein
MSKEIPLNPLTMTDEELIEHCDKQVQALRMALDMIECEKHDRRHVRWAIVDVLKEWKPAQPAPVQEPVAYRQTGWAAHRDQYAVPVLFNPYTGQPRDVRDVQSDPQGILIVPPGKIEMLAAKPTHQQGLQVDAPPAAQRQPDAYGYAKRLAVAIWEQHYKDVAPQWNPLDDLMGVLTQIDNMIAGLVTPPAAQPAVPDAFGTREGEHPQYVQGWNDCRAEMLKGMK